MASARPRTRNVHVSRDAVVVCLLTLAGAALRLSTILTRSLWLDEAISVQQAGQPLARVIQLIAENVHPPLFHMLLHFWIQVLGAGVFSIRLFSSTWGIACVPLAFWAGRAIYERRTGLVAAGIVAFSPYQIWYSQEARMYSLVMLFGLLSLGFLALALRDGSWQHWTGYGVFSLAGMFTHYFFGFLLLGEAIYVISGVLVAAVRLKRSGRAMSGLSRPRAVLDAVPAAGPWFIVMTVIGLLVVAWLSKSVFGANQNPQNSIIGSLTTGGLGYGQPPPSVAWRLNDFGMVVVQMVLGFHPANLMYALVAMWPLAVSAMLVAMGHVRRVGTLSMLGPCAASGILVIAGIGQWQGQVLTSRYFIALAAAAVVLVAALLASMPRHALITVLVAGAVLSLGTWADQSFNPKNMMRYDNDRVIAAIAAGYEPGDTVIYEPFFLAPLFTYYLPSSIPSHAFPQFAANGEFRSGKAPLGQDLSRVVNREGHVWLLLSFQDTALTRGDAYNTVKWFERNGFRVTRDLELNQVRLIEYEPVATRPGPGAVGTR